MEFSESIPVTFKEITPNYNIPEKWKEVILNTGNFNALVDIDFINTNSIYLYCSVVIFRGYTQHFARY